MMQRLFAFGSVVILSTVLIRTPAWGQSTPNPVTVKNTEIDAAKLSRNPQQDQGAPTPVSTPDQNGKQAQRHNSEAEGNKSVPTVSDR